VKDSHIAALNDHVQALQAQATILIRINKDLSDKVCEKKEEKKEKEKERLDNLYDKWLLFKRLDHYVAGRGKWKRIASELFSITCLRNHLIDETITHIRHNVYTPTDLVYITDMHHDLNITGIDNVHNIEYAQKHTKKLIWSSSEVNKLQRRAEKEMQEVIFFTLIK
jgi:hypothetical protein